MFTHWRAALLAEHLHEHNSMHWAGCEWKCATIRQSRQWKHYLAWNTETKHKRHNNKKGSRLTRIFCHTKHQQRMDAFGNSECAFPLDPLCRMGSGRTAICRRNQQARQTRMFGEWERRQQFVRFSNSTMCYHCGSPKLYGQKKHCHANHGTPSPSTNDKPD